MSASGAGSRTDIGPGLPGDGCRRPGFVPGGLVVASGARGARRGAHAVFRSESLLNTPLFVGFPGFVSKLWLADDEHGVYRGVYEWDGPARPSPTPARCGGCSRWSVCPRSIRYAVLPGLRRDELLADPDLADAVAPDEAAHGGAGRGRLRRP